MWMALQKQQVLLYGSVVSAGKVTHGSPAQRWWVYRMCSQVLVGLPRGRDAADMHWFMKAPSWAGARVEDKVALGKAGTGLIGPNAGRAGELELELGARSLRRRMTAGCHQNRTSQGSFRMLCDGARTNLQVRVAQTSQVRSLCPGGMG